MRKKILFLGGSYFQLPPILYAKQQGHYVITCDYLPQNPGHQYADAYYNISTTDMDSVLLLARNLAIDGVVAFASDPAAPTAAYVANRLNLPGNPFPSTLLLTRKDLFREFLREHQFNTPAAASFSSLENARDYFESNNQPMMVKPVDASGSKGVSKVIKSDHLEKAFERALSFSRTGKVILEEFIVRNGYQIAGDGFVADGRLVFKCFGQEHFNTRGNPFVPIGESFPLQISEAVQLKIHHEIQRLLTLLKMNSGAFNFDIALNRKGDIYLLEVGPRGGGNLISEVIKHTTGIDLAKLVVDAALGQSYEEKEPYQFQPCHSCYMLHTLEDGILKGIDYDKSICKNIIEKLVFVKNGDFIQSFDGSNHALGYLILKFNSPKEMLDKMNAMHKKIKVHITENRS
jgi:biotin carboxylase